MGRLLSVTHPRGVGGRDTNRLDRLKLATQVGELTRLRKGFGAREIEQDTPGLFRRVVDVLSRIEFAQAGFVEEIGTTGSLLGGLGRAGREIASGIGGLKGEKRGFSEVFERLGMGAGGRLSDVLPVLEGTIVGGITGRGTLGFVAAVALDPLTYMSFGGSAAAKVGGKLAKVGGRLAFREGTEAATKAGLRFVRKEVERLTPRVTDGTLKLADAPLELQRATRARVREAAVDRITRRVDDLFRKKKAGIRTRAEVARAIKIADDSALKGVARDDMLRAFGVDFRGRSFRDTLKRAIDNEVSAITKTGVDVGTKEGARLATDVSLIALEQAEKRLLAVARENPGLLYKHRGRGIHFLGRQLPGTPEAAIALSGASQKLAAAVARRAAENPRGVTNAVFRAGQGMKQAFDALGGLFFRDFSTRKLAGYNVLKQAHIDTHQAMIARLHDEIAESAVSKLKPEQFEKVTRAVERGQVHELTDEVEQAAARFMRDKQDEWAIAEVQAGLMSSDQIRQNYLAHFYDNSPDEIERVVRAWRPKQTNRATIGRHAEERVFDTLDQAVEVSTKRNRANPNVPVLRPVWDPVEILRRRGERHADAVAFGSWYDTVAKEFGEEVPFDLEDVFALVREQVPASGKGLKEIGSIEREIAKGGTSVDFVRRLSQAGKREFLRQRVLKVGSKPELINVLSKYNEFTDMLPSGGSLLGKLADDGSPYVAMSLPQLIGVEIPKSIADDIAEMSDRVMRNKDLNKLLRVYDKANNFFKRWVTIYFPAFHFRNFYSNTAQSFLDIGVHALDPRLHKHSVAVMVGKRTGKFADTVMEARNGVRYTDRQIAGLAEDNGIFGRVEQFTEQVVDPTARKARRGKNVVERAFRSTAVGIENEARLALFIQHLRRGLNPQQAAARVKQFLFDYDNLSRTEKDLFRRLFPFFVWTRKNIELQVRQLVSNPGRQANLLRMFRGRDSENNKMTTWEGEALKLRLDTDGQTVRMLTGVDLPVKGLDLIWNGSVRRTMSQALGMVTPLLKTPIELGSGKNLFTGQGLTRSESAGIGRIVEHMPPKVKDWIGWKKDVNPVTGKPRYTFDGERFYLLAQSWAFSRFVSTSNRAFKQYLDNDQWAAFLLDITTGLRFKDMNMTQEQRRRLIERRRQLEDVLERRGALVGFEKRFSPKKLGRLQ